jgi:flagellar biogenesis protein FliO
MEYLTLLRALISLCITLGLLVILAWAWKRWGSGFKLPTPSSRLSVIETKRLSAQTTLHLIKLDDTEHLIATTPTGTTILQTSTSQPANKKK